jgi:CheY-like chemotaxis protein
MLPKKILIIDDEKMIRLTTSILLKKEGIEVAEAVNGNEGLQKIEHEKPNLILLDIMMPIMDGWEVLDNIQKNENYNSIPVIIFTAGDFIEAEKKAKEKKVHGIIRKPFRLEKMLEIISLSKENNINE